MIAFYLPSPPASHESNVLNTSLGTAPKMVHGKKFSVTSVFSFLVYCHALHIRINYLIDSESQL